ncbi:hypothetical protein B0H10DRAFT_803076 [Mycena sp. CBHHK59/15]|nr:hypothetical protein B0H10DRAFT_803076 [Mycena sp. CBHHK59/15]
MDDDDSDARSVSTVTPHTLERVDEEDEEEEELVDNRHAHDYDDKKDEDHEQSRDTFRSSSPAQDQGTFHEQDEERAQRRAELGRPRTPEPTNMGMSRNLGRSATLRSPLPPSSSTDSLPTTATAVSAPNSSINDLTTRLTLLSTQLESALAMSSTLQAQHAAAQSTIVALEDKVKRLEGLVDTVVSAAASNKETDSKKEAVSADESPVVGESVTATLLSFKNSLQGQWTSVQEEWAEERERLERAREEWEAKMREMVDERIKTFSNSDFNPTTSLSRFPHGNGGLATPPSPRSLSSDSENGSIGRRRRKRSSSGRGRSGSPKGNGSVHASSPHSPISDDAITELARGGRGALVTPDPSVHTSSLSSSESRSLGPGLVHIAPTSPMAEVRVFSPMIVILFFMMLIVSCCRNLCMELVR